MSSPREVTGRMCSGSFKMASSKNKSCKRLEKINWKNLIKLFRCEDCDTVGLLKRGNCRFTSVIYMIWFNFSFFAPHPSLSLSLSHRPTHTHTYTHTHAPWSSHSREHTHTPTHSHPLIHLSVTYLTALSVSWAPSTAAASRPHEFISAPLRGDQMSPVHYVCPHRINWNWKCYVTLWWASNRPALSNQACEAIANASTESWRCGQGCEWLCAHSGGLGQQY